MTIEILFQLKIVLIMFLLSGLPVSGFIHNISRPFYNDHLGLFFFTISYTIYLHIEWNLVSFPFLIKNQIFFIGFRVKKIYIYI